MKISQIATPIWTALDNDASLWPMLTKDMLDNTGRSWKEYHRGGKGSHHAGRERVFEEFTTTAVWLGGRKAMNYTFLNPVLKRLGLDPAIDISLLLKSRNLYQAIPQAIAKRRQAYLIANVIKFLLGTIIPAGVIGWVIPPINQAITQEKVKQEEVKKQNAVPSYFAWPPPQYVKAVRFEGLSARALEAFAKIINNDLYSNIAIDAGISSGRLYRARNWADLMEVAVRESSIVLFMYFLGSFIKGQINRFLDRRFKAVTALTFETIAWLQKQQGKVSQWQVGLKWLKTLSPQHGFGKVAAMLNPTTGCFDKNLVLELLRHQRQFRIASGKEVASLKMTSLYAKKVLDPRAFLDINALKATGSDLAIAILQKLRTSPDAAKWMRQLQVTKRCKAISLLVSYLVSAICLGWLSPTVQHQLTQALTGKKDFPGIRKDLEGFLAENSASFIKRG